MTTDWGCLRTWRRSVVIRTVFFDEAGAQRIVIRQGDEAALEIVPTLNRLGFEIRSLIRNG